MAQVNTGIVVPLFRKIAEGFQKIFIPSDHIVLSDNKTTLEQKINTLSYNYIVEEGVKRGYKFNAITNGYELEHYLDLLSPTKICKLQITIDGPKAIHDTRRIHYKDHGTFDKIIHNISMALKKNIKVSVRINTDNHNVDKFIELKKYFSKIGFEDNPNFRIYTAILRDYDSISSSEHEKLQFINYLPT